MPPPGLLGLITRGAGALGQRLAATQQPQATTTPNPLQTAFTNALINPNMPIEAGFQTPSAKVNADLERQARIQNQLLAGRAAIIERARAQGRQVNVDQATGQLIIGDVPASSSVRTIGGQRFAFDAQGRPVGMAGDTGVAPPRMQGQTTPSVLTPEMADMNRQRIAAALGNAIRAAGRSEQSLQMRGPVPEPQFNPVAAQRAGLAPVTGAVSADGSTYTATGLPVLRPGARPMTAVAAPATPSAMSARLDEDLAALAEAERTAPGRVASLTPEQALAQAEQFIKQAPAEDAKAAAQARAKAYKQQVSETTRELTRARVRRDVNAVRLLSTRLANLMQNPPAADGGQGDSRPMTERVLGRGIIPELQQGLISTGLGAYDLYRNYVASPLDRALLGVPVPETPSQTMEEYQRSLGRPVGWTGGL